MATLLRGSTSAEPRTRVDEVIRYESMDQATVDAHLYSGEPFITSAAAISIDSEIKSKWPRTLDEWEEMFKVQELFDDIVHVVQELRGMRFPLSIGSVEGLATRDPSNVENKLSSDAMA